MQGLVITCLYVFIVGLVFVSIFYLHRNAKIQLQEYDVKTVTAADYTFDFDLSQELIDYFEEKYDNDEEMKS